MPNVFVVREQQKLADLAPALLRSRSSARVRESFLDAVRRANPGLDFDRIEPGAVVLVPAVEGVNPSAVASDPVHQAVGDLADRVGAAVTSLLAGAEAAEEQRVLEKKETQELLGGALVQRLAAQAPELASHIDSVRSTFKADDVEARHQLNALREAAQGWETDLEVLRSLLV
jgi:hypothetical protein